MAKTKILVVSNDPTMLDLFKQGLPNDLFEVSGTQQTDGKLVAALNEENPDLVLSDILMPSIMIGLHTCLLIRQLSQVPIIILSTWGAEKGKVRELDFTTGSNLTDSIGIDELTLQIEQVLLRNSIAPNSS